jgi:hypothetical protein
MRHLSRILLLGTAILALSGLAGHGASTAAPYNLPQLVVTSDLPWIDRFELHEKGIFWWLTGDSCGGETPRYGELRFRQLTLGTTHMLQTDDCDAVPDFSPNVVRDETYFYYVIDDALYRKPLSALPTDPATPLAAAGPVDEYLDLHDGFLYWPDYDVDSGSSLIYRMPVTEAEPPLPVTLVAGRVEQLEVFDLREEAVEEVAILIAVDGRLLRYRPSGGPFGNLAELYDGLSKSGLFYAWALDYTGSLRNGNVKTYVYAVRNGGLSRIDASTGDTDSRYTADADHDVVAVAVDQNLPHGKFDKNLYLTEVTTTCADPDPICVPHSPVTRRHSLGDGDWSHDSWDQIVDSTNGGGGVNLRSDGEWLYYRGFSATSADQIRRIRTDADPIEVDIAADYLEVVQTIQNIDNDIPLVAGRPTFVRGYAHLAQNTSYWNVLHPTAYLYGQRDGQDLPGSPLNPINDPPLDTTDALSELRADLDLSYLFQLPESWVADDASVPYDIVLTLELNPSGTIAETGDSPNSVSLTAPVHHKIRPCLVTFPVWAEYQAQPAFDPGTGTGAEIIARARSLMPLEDLRVFQPWQTGNAFLDQHFALTDDGDPFNLTEDAGDVLAALKMIALNSDPPPDCVQTFYAGLIHPNAEWMNDDGSGSVGGRAKNGGNVLMFKLSTGGTNEWDRPWGGRILAHELGHNYERKHIACGNFPDDEKEFDLNLPYDQCHLSWADLDDTATHFGFDSLKPYKPDGAKPDDDLKPPVIRSTDAADLMSYFTTRWASPKYWQALWARIPFDVFGAAFGAAHHPASPGRPEAAPALLVQGRVARDASTAQFGHFYLWEGPAAQTLAGSLARDRVTTYTLRLLDAAGTTLHEVPLLAERDWDQGGGIQEADTFVQWVSWHVGTVRVQLLDGTRLLAERAVSASPPQLALDPLALDSADQKAQLSWTAGDADGDPLRAIVQYSADGGLTWRTLFADYPWRAATVNLAGLPGSPQARLRVLMSDGVNTASAVSPAFEVPDHAPRPLIAGVQQGQRIPFGRSLQLYGMAPDAEEGSLEGERLDWHLDGPQERRGRGSDLSLNDLPPGHYTLTLVATDTDDLTGTATRDFEVLPVPVPDGSTPLFDGTCDDAAYDQATFLRLANAEGPPVRARLLHAGEHLYVCLGELAFPALPRGNRFAGLRVDADASADAVAQVGDIGFFVDQDGIPYQVAGDGAAMPVNGAPELGYSVLVAHGDQAWSAELRIAQNLVGGWDHAARLAFGVNAATLTSDDATWPLQAGHAAPDSWAEAYLGTPPPPANRAPYADAGQDVVYYPARPQSLNLDGSASADPDGDEITYTWSQVAGPATALDDPTSAAPGFAVAPVDAPVTLRFRLVVRDAALESDPAEVEISLQPPLGTNPGLSLDPFAIYLPMVVR